MPNQSKKYKKLVADLPNAMMVAFNEQCMRESRKKTDTVRMLIVAYLEKRGVDWGGTADTADESTSDDSSTGDRNGGLDDV